MNFEKVYIPASQNDLNVYKTAWSNLHNRTFFGGKINMNHDFNEQLKREFNSEMLSPIKAVKRMAGVIKQRIKEADDLFSKAVSRVRQPIEDMFAWLIEKTDMQRASVVSSIK